MSVSSSSAQLYLPIEDYGLIGDLHTAALVGKNGSIDWCCLPRFDSPGVFCALLDAEKGGYFRICPTEATDIRYMQMYLPETNILLTRFLSSDGVGELTDFMPIKQPGTQEHQHQIIRSVHVIHCSLAFNLVCRPTFNFAQEVADLSLEQEGALFRNHSLHLSLASPVPLYSDRQGGVRATFTLHAGQSLHFVLESSRESGQVPQPLTDNQYQQAFHATSRYWHRWIGQCQYQGRWREMVQRSALALKLMTYDPTGAIVAAPTTSLPEIIGGSRNWDYRYTWLRDSSFTLDSLLSLGFTEEAEAFMRWLDARCHQLKDGSELQPVYGINGQQQLPESTLDHLEGYCQSRPVRVGNEAYKQKQLDIYGEMMESIFIYNRYEAISYDLWQRLNHLLGWLGKNWQEPDDGIWEVRGGSKHFLSSRVMEWAAFDRALRIADKRGWPASVDSWMKTRTEIYTQVMNRGWSAEQNSFVQYYDSSATDASELLLPLTGFTGPKEPRILSTVRCIQQELTSGALVYRYNPQKAASDGQKGQEGTFFACSFWLVDVLAQMGHLREARLSLEKLLSYTNHVGLFSEEISPDGQALGNYPQALTHLTLIQACIHLDQALNAHHEVI
jgi:GH15 family glucan-1,4-alpha-glucosidase